MSGNDRTTISNRTLSAIGVDKIDAPDENSKAAAEIELIWDGEIRALLRQVPWNFARRQNALAVLKAARGTPENLDGTVLPLPPEPWLYSYAHPSDCAAERYIRLPAPVSLGTGAVPLTPVQEYAANPGEMRNRVPFQPAGDTIAGVDVKVILCNARQAQLVYTGFVTSPAVWDDLFVVALIGRLAQLLVQPLAGDKSLARMAINAAAVALAQAEKANANEGTTTTEYTPDWMAARDSYGGDFYGGGWDQ